MTDKDLYKPAQSIIKNYPLINKDSIIGHSDVSPQRKTDPGDKFDWIRFLEAI